MHAMAHSLVVIASLLPPLYIPYQDQCRPCDPLSPLFRSLLTEAPDCSWLQSIYYFFKICSLLVSSSSVSLQTHSDATPPPPSFSYISINLTSIIDHTPRLISYFIHPLLKFSKIRTPLCEAFCSLARLMDGCLSCIHILIHIYITLQSAPAPLSGQVPFWRMPPTPNANLLAV